ncbi:peptide chain release factor N(5)-glutamine methyltransferase [Thermodesulfobacterium sp. TA1]|uniref:peptide chain release factor N(5)-glutamine methyltransferase n=1 Tax=Thermodesulfobacterium sp. TA1 TaxID=2234087 RepID=UPI001231EA3B|nr:peptide chain release factor N(5)-glutamine methyltransferase [Thermodesulfobacterium sp. TA1]QER41206.1 peptide chain release factor N(5)-glutamine methyltransferase [Thermodesulfobacterium sp. TA1]
MKVSQAFNQGKKLLSQIEDPEYANWEVLLILSYLLKVKPLEVYLFFDKDIPEEEFFKIIQARLTKKPLAYILKEAYFWGRKFEIEEGVLIPRQDTEILIEAFLDLGIEKGKVLEVGVGSGINLITLLLEKSGLEGFGVDINPKTLRLTFKNARLHQVEKRIFLFKGDGLTLFKNRPIFEVILSNPPYLSLKEWEDLEEEVRIFEPKEALVAGTVGTEFHERLMKEAPFYLKKGGFLILEMGYNQGKKIRELARRYEWKSRFYQDLRGYERVVVLWKD